MDRLHDGLSALRQTLEYARKYQCPWVFGGDLKVPRRTWPHDALTGALAVLSDYREVPKYAIPGNHDGDGDFGTGLLPFASDSMYVHEHAGVMDIEGVGPVAVWPAKFGDHDPAEWLKSVPPGVDVLIGHGYLAGAKTGPDEFRAPGGLTLEQFGFVGRDKPRFKLGLFGDIHKGQVLHRQTRGRAPDWIPFDSLTYNWSDGTHPMRDAAPWLGEVYYPGSPYPQNWGERNDGPKGCLLVDLASGEVTFLPVQAPRYVLEDWTEKSETPSWLPERALDGEAQLIRRWRGNFVRVMAGSWLTDDFRKALDRLVEKAEPRTFTLEVQKTARSEHRAEVHGGMPVGDMLASYVQARPLSGIENEHVIAAGLALAEGE